MKYYVVIPAYNEARFLNLTLDSLAQQTVLPAKVVVVDDNSADNTYDVASNFAEKHQFIAVVKTTAEAKHMPGSKVINAFNIGFAQLDQDYDIIVKLDADLILPSNYFEQIIATFNSDATIGMAGGFAYIEKNGEWTLENLTDKDHIRGAFKAYRKKCFHDIGMLKPAMGWDTVDELLARFHNWKVVTLPDLKVKHLKPTGKSYDKSARYKQGEAFYALGYGFWITAIASVKLALRKGKPMLAADYISGYFKAKMSKKPMLVTAEQARFVRKYRLQIMAKKIFN
ncbi:MAG: glycosyltransferase family 2 protein [Flavobacterium sp.]|nr:glycosyltransferase family 2 protein [Flavobacterium sp.]